MCERKWLVLSAGVDDSVVLVRCGVHWGSGVVVDSRDGIILTCSHVVSNVSTFSASTEFRLRCRIVAICNDPKNLCDIIA
jgi:S1-C subfamily serine protease